MPLPPPGDLSDPGVELRSPTLWANSSPSEPQGNSPKRRLKSGGWFGPDAGSGTTEAPRHLPVPRAAFDTSAPAEEEEEGDDEGEDEEAAVERGAIPRWAQLGASQWPLPPHPNHQKTSSQSRPRRAVRDFRTLLHSENRLADTPLQALGHHVGQRRNLHTQEPPFTPERGIEATGALPHPAVILNPPRDHLLPGWVCSVLSWLRRG